MMRPQPGQMNFADQAHALALFLAGTEDEVCPPATVYAAYNHYAGLKDIRVWPCSHMECGGGFHAMEKVEFLQKPWNQKLVQINLSE